MTEQQKQAIIESEKEYFRITIIPNHLKNLQKLKLASCNINPFLINYLAAFLCGDTETKSFAKVLVYPRILGTSLNILESCKVLEEEHELEDLRYDVTQKIQNARYELVER